MKRAAALLTIALACTCASADTVWLKNGVSIKANKALYKGDQVEYIVGTTTYYIPASQVARIEKSQTFGVAVSTVGPNVSMPSGPADLPADEADPVTRKVPARSGITVSDGDALLKKVLIYDHVDDRALRGIEGEGDPNKSAAAYAVAANYEYRINGDADKARQYTKRALDFAPTNATLLCWYSSLLLESGEYTEAVSRAEAAVNSEPNSPDTLYQLGAAYYATNRLPEAIAAWKRSLSLRPNENLKQYLAKAERESAVEENFQERGSSHFTIRFQGQRTGFTLAGDILHALERQYAELSRDLNYTPQESITVILYTQQEFFDVTQSPSWSAGVNDGKMRIPVKNLTTLSPEFERVLKHELAHSFIHSITRGNCPGWINEGLAQVMEGRNPAYYEPGIAQLFRAGKQVPLGSLEGAFSVLNEEKAEIAYAESLVVVAYLQSAYGVVSVHRILDQLATGQSPEDAVREIIQRNYSQLEKEIGASLNSKYKGQ